MYEAKTIREGGLVSVPEDPPAGEAQDTHHRAHRRRLSGSVASDQPDDLPGADGGAQVVHGDAVAEVVDEVANLQHGSGPAQPDRGHLRRRDSSRIAMTTAG